METLGQFLKAVRRGRQLTLGQLSLRAGVNKATLSRWESGTTFPRIPELKRVLDALDAGSGLQEQAYRRFDAPRAIVAAREGADVSVAVSLGDMLYGLRERSGKSQLDVAREAGVSRALLRLWESDGCAPSDAQLHGVGFAVGAAADELTALSARRFATEPLARSREAVMHTLATTGQWNFSSGAVYRMTLLSFLAFLSRERRHGKGDAGDLALLYTKFGESAEYVTGEEDAANRWYARACSCAKDADEPIHFHVISSVRMLLDKKKNPVPLRQRINDTLEWKPRFKTDAGKAYLLMFVAKALAEESPDEALRLADEYCALVADDAGEYPCRLRDRGNLLLLCGRPAESVAFIEKLAPQDTFRDGLKHLEMARGLIALGSKAEARQCVDAGKRKLLPTSHMFARTLISDLEHAVH